MIRFPILTAMQCFKRFILLYVMLYVCLKERKKVLLYRFYISFQKLHPKKEIKLDRCWRGDPVVKHQWNNEKHNHLLISSHSFSLFSVHLFHFPFIDLRIVKWTFGFYFDINSLSLDGIFYALIDWKCQRQGVETVTCDLNSKKPLPLVLVRIRKRHSVVLCVKKERESEWMNWKQEVFFFVRCFLPKPLFLWLHFVRVIATVRIKWKEG